MNKVLLILSLVLVASCGPSQQEKEKIAAVTCSIMSETRNMDAAVRVEKMNEAREKIGGEPFLRGDDAIKDAFGWGLCQELVLNEIYDESLQSLKDAKRERERIAAVAAEIRAERARLEWEAGAEDRKIAAEKQRIADSKPTVKEKFYTNGKLKERVHYQSKKDGGKYHGLIEFYDDNGNLKARYCYEEGEMKWFDKSDPSDCRPTLWYER